MSEFERQVLEELATVKAQMQHLMGIGQPGRLHQLEMRVESHERSVQRLKGLTGGIGAMMTLVHLGLAMMSNKR